MARSRRDPPPKMFQRSELRRLLSMAFLMAILFMVIQNSLPDNRRLLVGRAGNKDQVVTEIDEDAVDQPDRVPASPKPNAAKPVVRAAAAHSTVAVAQAAFAQANGARSDSATPAPAASSGNSTSSPPPPGIAAPKGETPSEATPSEAAPGKGSPSTATPAFPLRSNPVPTQATPQSPADQQPAAGQPAPDAAANKIPAAIGPDDEDPDEAAAAQEDLQFVDDYSVGSDRPEMPAYERLTRWITNQSYERLVARSKLQKVIYSQIVAGSSDYRGKLFQFDLHVRRAIPYPPLHFYNSQDDPHEPAQLYEMWGDTGEGRGRLYQLIVYDPPAGMPIGPNIQEDVRFVGYFFKLQGYEAAKALPGAKPEVAPTFIGRVLWKERPPSVLVRQADVWWIATLGGGVLLILIAFFAWLFFRKSRPNVAQLSLDMANPATGSAVSIDEWLDRPVPGGNAERDAPTRNDDAGDDETDPGPTQNGHGNGHARLFSDRPDDRRS